MMGGGEAMLMPQTVISDATLEEMGMTRTGFLTLLAESLFGDSGQTIYVVIPVTTQTVAADGTIETTVSFLQVELSSVSPDVIDTVDTVFITDGISIMQVNFVTALP